MPVTISLAADVTVNNKLVLRTAADSWPVAGRDNVPTKTMYQRLGFVHLEDKEVIAGLWVARYIWSSP